MSKLKEKNGSVIFLLNMFLIKLTPIVWGECEDGEDVNLIFKKYNLS